MPRAKESHCDCELVWGEPAGAPNAAVPGLRGPCYTEAMDMERAVEFCIEQQAKLFAGLERMREEVREEMREEREEMRQRQDVLQTFVERIAQSQLNLTEHVNDFQRQISAIVLTIAEEQKRLANEQARLAEAQRHTQESLNTLIAVVDGIVRRPPQQ